MDHDKISVLVQVGKSVRPLRSHFGSRLKKWREESGCPHCELCVVGEELEVPCNRGVSNMVTRKRSSSGVWCGQAALGGRPEPERAVEERCRRSRSPACFGGSLAQGRQPVPTEQPHGRWMAGGCWSQDGGGALDDVVSGE